MNRFWLVLIFSLFIFFLFMYFSARIAVSSSNNKIVSSSTQKEILDFSDTTDEVAIFRNIGKKHKTDKVSDHSYHHLYGLYLGPIKNKNLTLLEIGLGCGMPYGPGKSLQVWLEYLPNSQVDILEFDKKCAQSFRSLTRRLYTGDQSDMKLLNKIASESSYNVIVDDGGHTRKQQILSLIGLWPALKPKGIYVIEDLYVTEGQDPYYLDLSISTIKVMEYFMYRLNYKKNPISLYEKELDEIFASLLSVNCFKEACVLIKS